MRSRADNGVLGVLAVGGTHVVMLGLDMVPAARRGLLGFAIHRTDPTEGEAYYLSGLRSFEASYPNPPAGAQMSSREHPVQDFLWSDFTAKPGRLYTYRIEPLYGKPKALQVHYPLTVDVHTEAEDDGVHSVHFNRGVIGSQAYARRWPKAPDELPPDQAALAWQWLSRGLEEALLAFINQAVDGQWALRVAAYEFSHAPVAQALAAARARGADVQIVYDARISQRQDGTPDPDEAARVAKAEALLAAHGLLQPGTSSFARRRNPGFIAHNKFIVLLRRAAATPASPWQPQAVWTGSTNFTRSGLFGQANVGHVLREPALAAPFAEAWQRLAADPEAAALRSANEAATPLPAQPLPPTGTRVLFSPRQGLASLQWLADLLDSVDRHTALSALTAAFGVNKRFLADYAQDRAHLRYLFLEKWGLSAAQVQATQRALGADPDVQVAVGAAFDGTAPTGWLQELLNPVSSHVRFVHTKFMLVDPLGDDPVVVSGSANFSDASTTGNDENMLVIRGSTRVADIYLGEFMRLWRHHHYRGIVQRADPAGGAPRPNYLAGDDRWSSGFFIAGSAKAKRRLAFAGGVLPVA